MVIATQQVNKTIKKSRANSYFETVQSIRKGMQTACANDNSVDGTKIKAYVEFSDVVVSYTEQSDDTAAYFTVEPTEDGKFKNLDGDTLNSNVNGSSIYSFDGESKDSKIKFNSEC